MNDKNPHNNPQPGDKVLLLHPWFFALFPPLSLFAHNMDRVGFSSVFRTLALTLSGVLLLTGLLSLVLKDIKKAGIISSFFFLLFFSYGRLQDQVAWWTRNMMIPGRELWLIVVIIAFQIFLIRWVIRKVRGIDEITGILNCVGGVLIALCFLNIVGGHIRGLRLKESLSSSASVNSVNKNDNKGSVSMSDHNKPDIYYIILDGYAREDILKELYGYDNSAFMKFLRHRGFYVAEESHSNYCQTCISLSSSLNFEHVLYLSENPGEESVDHRPLIRLVHNNKVRQFLKEKGYILVSFATGYRATEITDGDIFMTSQKGGMINEFESLFLNTTLMSGLKFINDAQYRNHRQRILYTFEELPHIRKNNPSAPPMMVFAHIISPHPPFVFDRDGGEVKNIRKFALADGNDFYDMLGNREDYKTGYPAQLEFLTKKTMEAVDGILASYPHNPPIIIIQSDHGSGMELSYKELDKTNIKERFSILNAYYLPEIEGKEKPPLYPSITPVNSFRMVFNHYFDAHLPLLTDKSYYSTASNPYRFTEVSHKIKK